MLHLVKAIRQFCVNVIACQLATGERRWYIVVTVWGVEVVMTKRPMEADLVVAGDFNIDFLMDGRMDAV